MACLLLDAAPMRKACALMLLVLTSCTGGGSPNGADKKLPPFTAPPANDPRSQPADPLPEPTADQTPMTTPSPATMPMTSPSPSAEPSAPPSPTPAPMPSPTPAQPTHTHCGWIGGGDTVGEADFVANAAQFDTIHPKWWALADDGQSIRVAGHPDLATVVNAARANHVRLQPMVDGEGGDLIRTMINDPARRAAHAAALAKLAVDHGYDGLDLDYEHLNTIDDRAGFTAFVTQVAAAMHAAGKELSLAVPAIAVEHNNNGYSYETLAGIVDTLHVMTYDFHYIVNSHLGPIAPLGWVDAVFARAQATGHPDKFMLGLANYAIGNGWWTTARDALNRCGANLVPTTTHMLSCTFGNWDAGRSPHCTTSSGDVWFEDIGSMGEKIAAAKKHGARGVTYWTVGDELDGYFDLVRRNFP
jgi:Glycosyl hydrolases family 18